MGGGSSTTNVTPPPTAQELMLQGLSVQEKTAQIEALKKQSAYQDQYYNLALPQLQRQADLDKALSGAIGPDDIAAYTKAQFDREAKLGPIQDELLQLQLNDARRGGAATPEQEARIKTAADSAIASGSGDIDDATRESLRLIREELAPSLGLRPTDSPILDRGNMLGREAQIQKGALTRGVRAGEAQSLLNYPLAAQQIQGAQNQGQQTLLNSVSQFRAQLQQQAFQNRLSLSGQVAQSGLGLSSVGAGAGGFRPTGTSNSTTSNTAGLAQYGQLASGVGALILASDRNVKDPEAPADLDALLEGILSLPLDSWRYKGNGQVHVGPYAQDFRNAFGLGDGKSIPIVDALGVLFGAVKALALKVRELEAVPDGAE